jgi:hypothetical protein
VLLNFRDYCFHNHSPPKILGTFFDTFIYPDIYHGKDPARVVIKAAKHGNTKQQLIIKEQVCGVSGCGMGRYNKCWKISLQGNLRAGELSHIHS